MRKGHDNDWGTAMTWAPEGHHRRVDLGKQEGEQQTRREKELNGGAGGRCPLIS